MFKVKSIQKHIEKIHLQLQIIEDLTQQLPYKECIFIILLKESLDSICMHGVRKSFSQICKLLAKEEKDSIILKKIISYAKALELCYQVDKTHKIQIDTIEKINFFVERDYGKVKEEPGHLRTKQNWIGNKGCTKEEALFFPPPPKKVPALLKKLLRYIDKKEEPIIQLAIFFLIFLEIHPFMDGNGRTMRILFMALMKQKGMLSLPLLSMTRYFHIHRIKYLNILTTYRKTKSSEKWLHFFIKGMFVESKLLRDNLKDILELSDQIDIALFDVKAKQSIHRFLMKNPMFTIPVFAKKTRVSKRTVRKVLKELLVHKIVKKKDEFYIVSKLIKIGKKNKPII